MTAGANVIDFTSDAAGRLSHLDRASASASLAYDGRSFLTAADGGAGSIFRDGFESGDFGCWDLVIGGPPGAAGSCFEPGSSAKPIYSSEGVLQAVFREGSTTTGPADDYVFYFAGRPVAQAAVDSGGAATFTFLTTDHLGTPPLATDIAGALLWQGGFEPFGQDYAGAQAAGVFLRFPGQWEDEAWEAASLGAEVFYNVHRWYGPGIGRYGRVDLVGLLDGGVNPFAYGLPNPLAFSDELGLIARFCCRPLRGIFRSLGNHCYVIADDGTRYGLYPEKELGVRIGLPRENDERDKGGTCADCPCEKGDDQNRCLKETADQYPIGRYDDSGPNSNTFAGNLARTCCKGGVPSGFSTKDSPGLDDKKPNPLFFRRNGRITPRRQ